MSLPANMTESWEWNPEYGAWFYSIRVQDHEWKYERLIEENPATLPDEIMQFYRDDAREAFVRETAGERR